MTELFKVRIERKLLSEATDVADEIGTTPDEVVRLLFKQMVKRRAIPFPLNADAPEEVELVNKERRNEIWRQLDDSEGW